MFIVIEAATHKSKRQIEELVASMRPQPPVPPSVRKLAHATRGASGHRAARVQAELPVSKGEIVEPHMVDPLLEASSAAEAYPVRPAPRAAIKPLAPEHYLVKFTASCAMHEKLREAQALLRHQVPSGDVAEIFDRALTLLLAKLRRARHGATHRPRPTHRTSNTGRHVPAAVKREVWARDGGRCAFVGAIRHGECHGFGSD